MCWKKKSAEISKIKLEAEAKNTIAQEKTAIVGGESKIAQEKEKRVSEMKARIDEESAKFHAELNKFKPIMDKCITLAKSIKKEYLDKDRQIKTKPLLFLFFLCLLGALMNIQIEVDNKALKKKSYKMIYLPYY